MLNFFLEGRNYNWKRCLCFIFIFDFVGYLLIHWAEIGKSKTRETQLHEYVETRYAFPPIGYHLPGGSDIQRSPDTIVILRIDAKTQ